MKPKLLYDRTNKRDADGQMIHMETRHQVAIDVALRVQDETGIPTIKTTFDPSTLRPDNHTKSSMSTSQKARNRISFAAFKAKGSEDIFFRVSSIRIESYKGHRSDYSL